MVLACDGRLGSGGCRQRSAIHLAQWQQMNSEQLLLFDIRMSR
jgi:hypothetical protein